MGFAEMKMAELKRCRIDGYGGKKRERVTVPESEKKLTQLV
jgi:hypothetical protein